MLKLQLHVPQILAHTPHPSMYPLMHGVGIGDLTAVYTVL
jgi:hypothetical protein